MTPQQQGRGTPPALTRFLLILGIFLAGLVTVTTAVLILSPRSPVSTAGNTAVGGAFRLVDQAGRVVTEQDLKGRPSLIFFGFTHCPDICPTTLFEVSEVLTRLGADAERVNAVFITVDPERDTPELLGKYLGSFHPRLIGLSGDATATEAVIRAYRVYARKVPLEKGGYTMDHTAAVYLMNKDGAFIAPFKLKRDPAEAASDLRRFL
jgi:protein SCO1/2